MLQMASKKEHKAMGSDMWMSRLRTFAATRVLPSDAGNRPSSKQPKWHSLYTKATTSWAPCHLRTSTTTTSSALCHLHTSTSSASPLPPTYLHYNHQLSPLPPMYLRRWQCKRCLPFPILHCGFLKREPDFYRWLCVNMCLGQGLDKLHVMWKN